MGDVRDVSGIPLVRRWRAVGIGLVLVCTAAVVALASPTGVRGAEDDRDPALQRAVDAAVAAGSVGFVARVDDGDRVAVAVAGLADRATGRRLQPDDQFDIGSNTKTFMATIALQLVGEGRLSLSDSVEHLLPGVVPAGNKITLKMLLQHTSGLPDYMKQGDVALDPQRRWTPAQLVALVADNPTDFAPGTSWGYSNTNYLLVGMILQRVTGQQPAALLRYVDLSGEAIGNVWNTAAAVVSTAPELSRFFSALLGGELLRPAQLAQMRTVIPASPGFGAHGGYGLGLMKVETPCGTVWGHNGSTRGNTSTAYFSADGRRSAVTDATVQRDAAPEAIRAAQLTAICRMYDKQPPPDATPGAGRAASRTTARLVPGDSRSAMG